jgi:hypothetical protein
MQTKGVRNNANARKKLAIEWNQLRARIFHGPAGKADERYFKNEIAGWIAEPWTSQKRTWAQLLFDLIAKRNNDPARLKYCFYSRTHQRALPTKDFETWAAGARRQLEKVLTQIHGA